MGQRPIVKYPSPPSPGGAVYIKLPQIHFIQCNDFHQYITDPASEKIFNYRLYESCKKGLRPVGLKNFSGDFPSR